MNQSLERAVGNREGAVCVDGGELSGFIVGAGPDWCLHRQDGPGPLPRHPKPVW